MARTVFVSMLDHDWATTPRGFTATVIEIQRLCAAPVPAGVDGRESLHVVLAPEYTFRKNPAAVVRNAAETYHGGNGRTPAAAFAALRDSTATSTMYSRADKNLLLYHMGSATRGRNVLVAPGTMFWEETAPTYRTTRYRRNRVLATRGVARNTCFVVYRGELIETYHKQTPSHELDRFEEATHDFRAGVTPSAFDVSGLSVGLEICADLSSANSLRSEAIQRNNPNMDPNERYVRNRMTTPHEDGTVTEFGLDLQLVLSDGMGVDRGTVAIRRGGAVAHCDTRIEKTVQRRQLDNVLAPIPSLAANHWRIDYDAAPGFADAAARLQAGLVLRRPDEGGDGGG